MKPLIQSAVALALKLAASGWAQAYPAKTIRMVVSFPASGPVDQTARLLGAKLTTALGQQFTQCATFKMKPSHRSAGKAGRVDG